MVALARNPGVQPLGEVAGGFEEVLSAFARMLAEEPGFAAQVCAYVDGRCVVDLWGGPDVAGDSIQGVFSSTKGVSAVCIGRLVQQGQLDLDAPVSRYWPEFAEGAKAEVTVRCALSHQAGLVGLEPQLSFEDLIDHEQVAARLAAQVPQWRPGAAHGYHAQTIGTIMDELVRRITGTTIAEFFRREIGDERGIDFFIALPEAEEGRVRSVLPQRLTEAQETRRRPVDPDSLAGMAANARGSGDVLELANSRAGRAAGLAASGGVGSARGLARLYASTVTEASGPRLLDAATVTAMSQIQSAGDDLVLGMPTRYGIVFQKPDDRLRYGSYQAFGHDGAGGSVGLADPLGGIGFGYVPRRMSFPLGVDTNALELASLVRDGSRR